MHIHDMSKCISIKCLPLLKWYQFIGNRIQVTNLKAISHGNHIHIYYTCCNNSSEV